jgi:hypothetical protein
MVGQAIIFFLMQFFQYHKPFVFTEGFLNLSVSALWNKSSCTGSVLYRCEIAGQRFFVAD